MTAIQPPPGSGPTCPSIETSAREGGWSTGFIDPNAASPGLLRGRELSSDTTALLAQLDLPNAHPDEVLSLLVSFPGRPASPAHVPRLTELPRSAEARSPSRDGDGPMVTVPASEWRRLRDLDAAQRATSGAASVDGTPAWPGYALLGVSAVSTGLAIYSFARVAALNDDPDLTRYGEAIFLSRSDLEEPLRRRA